MGSGHKLDKIRAMRVRDLFGSTEASHLKLEHRRGEVVVSALAIVLNMNLV